MDRNRGMGIDICRNRGTGNNMVQDRVESPIVTVTFTPKGDIPS